MTDPCDRLTVRLDELRRGIETEYQELLAAHRDHNWPRMGAIAQRLSQLVAEHRAIDIELARSES